jgi:anti-anti-sigma factor
MPEPGLIVSSVSDVTVVDFKNMPVLDAAAVRAIAPQLLALLEGPQGVMVLLDMRTVHFLASPMIGTLVMLHKRAVEARGRLVICGLSANLMRVFQVSGLTSVLSFAPGVDEGAAVAAASRTVGAAPIMLPIPPPTSGGGAAGVVKQHLRTFFAGALVVVPLSITVWVIMGLGTWLEGLGYGAVGAFIGESAVEPIKWLKEHVPGLGAITVLVVVYMVGLLTRLYVFRWMFGIVERMVLRLPGAKTVYESVRDLMQLFGGDSARMGRVVQYSMPGTDVATLGILTNENPMGVRPNDPNRKVAVYMPMSYMLGGPTLLVSPDQIAEVDMPVEQALKICAMAHLGGHGPGVLPPIKGAEPAKQ